MHLLDSIRNALVPLHRAGYPFVAGFFVASIVLGLLWEPLFWIGLVLTAWCAYFFRDPVRVTPVDADLVVSPADGRVSFVGHAPPPPALGLAGERVLRVSIFMNVFDCHVNRTPVPGLVKSVAYTKGEFRNAELDKASEVNERNAVVIASAKGDIGVVQIAGFVARRILCFVQPGVRLQPGERFGLIRFGSRLDVYLPEGANPRIAEGQTAIGGETVIAAFDAGPPHLTTRRD